MGDRNIVLTAVKHMEPFYKSLGFIHPSKHKNATVSGIPKEPKQFRIDNNMQIEDITDSNIKSITDYDQSVSFVDRSWSLNILYKSNTTAVAKCAIENNKVKGYIVIRDGLNEMRSSTFYADNVHVAEQLLYSAIKEVPQGIRVSMGFSSANLQNAKLLYEKFGLINTIVSDAGWCTKADVDFQWEKVYAVQEWFSVYF